MTGEQMVLVKRSFVGRSLNKRIRVQTISYMCTTVLGCAETNHLVHTVCRLRNKEMASKKNDE